MWISSGQEKQEKTCCHNVPHKKYNESNIQKKHLFEGANIKKKHTAKHYQSEPKIREERQDEVLAEEERMRKGNGSHPYNAYSNIRIRISRHLIIINPEKTFYDCRK